MNKKTRKKKETKKTAKKKSKRSTKSKPTQYGRESNYKAAFAKRATELIAAGKGLKDIAETFGVCVATIYRWKTEQDEFAAAIEAGFARLADDVEVSFMQLALPHDEVVEVEGEKDETRTKKNVVSVRAAERVLKAHKPGKYGDKVEHRGDVHLNVVDFAHATADTPS